jgi:hypothetical protein
LPLRSRRLMPSRPSSVNCPRRCVASARSEPNKAHRLGGTTRRPSAQAVRNPPNLFVGRKARPCRAGASRRDQWAWGPLMALDFADGCAASVSAADDNMGSRRNIRRWGGLLSHPADNLCVAGTGAAACVRPRRPRTTREYGDCAMPTCVSPSNEAGTTKSATIGIPYCVSPFRRFCLPFTFSLRKAQIERRRPGAFVERSGSPNPADCAKSSENETADREPQST